MTFTAIQLGIFVLGWLATLGFMYLAGGAYGRRLGQGEAAGLVERAENIKFEAHKLRNEAAELREAAARTQRENLDEHRREITERVTAAANTRIREQVAQDIEQFHRLCRARIQNMEAYEFRRTASSLHDILPLRIDHRETSAVEFGQLFETLLAAHHVPIVRITPTAEGTDMYRIEMTVHAVDASQEPPVTSETCLSYMIRGRTNVGSTLAELFPQRERRRSRTEQSTGDATITTAPKHRRRVDIT